MTQIDVSNDRVEEIRRFNRFYTRQIGVLRRGHLNSEFTLAETRVLYELAHRPSTTAAQLAAELDLDAGYLSRMLRGFSRKRLISRKRQTDDGRERSVSLTAAGRTVFAQLDQMARDLVVKLIAPLDAGEQDELAASMAVIERLLDSAATPSTTSSPPWVLRPPDPGDLGWILHRQGVLYTREYGWDWRFEGLLAGVLSEFVSNFMPSRDRCWVAERDGKIVGSVFVVHASPTLARLRLLYVEPSARGLGLGRALVRECLEFARKAGYQRMTLWTNSVLTSARRIYEAEGFQLTESGLHDHFGVELTGETWERDL